MHIKLSVLSLFLVSVVGSAVLSSCGQIGSREADSRSSGVTEFEGFALDLRFYVEPRPEQRFASFCEDIRDLSGNWEDCAAMDKALGAQVDINDPVGPYAALSIMEKRALRLYSSHGSQPLNQALWGRDRDWLTRHQSIVLAIASGLNKLPPEASLAYRGIELPASAIEGYRVALRDGSLKVERGFTSTSSDPELMGPFCDGRIFMKLRLKSGRAIQAFSIWPKEKELTVAPGAEFRIRDIREEALPGCAEGKVIQKTVIEMEEELSARPEALLEQ